MIKGDDNKSFDAMSFLGAVITGDRETIDKARALFDKQEKRELARIMHRAARLLVPGITCSELLRSQEMYVDEEEKPIKTVGEEESSE